MRVLFTLLPGTGSLHPLVPVAEALARSGHEVAFCSSRSFRPEAEATGFPDSRLGHWLVRTPTTSRSSAERPASSSRR